MIADGRGTDAPPCDSLAEGMVLAYLVDHPDLIGRVDVGPLLTNIEYQRCWQSMQRTARTGYSSDLDFYLRWRDDLRTRQPQHWLAFIELVLSAPSIEAQRADEQYERHGHMEPRFSRYFHDFDWWLARLQAVAERRRLISAASRIHDEAWHDDDYRPYTVADAAATLECHATPGSGFRHVPIRDIPASVTTDRPPSVRATDFEDV